MNVMGTLRVLATSEDPRGYRLMGRALLAALAVLGVSLALLGAPPVVGPWDEMQQLSVAWRILQGQAPHLGFHHPIGPLTYVLTAFGMKLGGPSVAAITYGEILLTAPLVSAAWHIAKNRLPWGPAALFVAFVGILLLSPHPLGYPVHETSSAMIYNRQGYALAMLLFLSALVPPREGERSSPLAQGLLEGALLGLAFYCKVTYFAIGVGAVALSPWIAPRDRRWIAGLGLGFGAVLIAFVLACGVQPLAYLQDVASAGQAQVLSQRRHLLAASVRANRYAIGLLIAVVGIWTWRRHPPAGALRLNVLAAWTVAAALFIASGNAAQGGGVDDPLYFLGALLVLETARRSAAASGRRFGGSLYAAALVVASCAGILARDVASLAYGARWDLLERPHYPASRELHASPLHDFRVPETTTHITGYWPAREHPARINDGIDLVRAELRPGDRVTALAYVNPFPYALGLHPASDAMAWWDLHFDFDETHHVSPEAFLGDASLVIMPRIAPERGGDWPTVEVLLRLYGEYLHTHFREVSATDTWLLYRKLERGER